LIWCFLLFHGYDFVNGFLYQLYDHNRIMREKAGMSQQDLADSAEISKLTIQRIENAKYSVTIYTLI
jgi:predicted transcriptional regulator